MTTTASESKGSTRRFGGLSFDARTGELRKGDQRTRLSPHLASLLEALIERPGELVTREALCARVWPADTFVDFEHGLTAAVNKLREALDDSVHEPVFIETIPRRGYRWLVAVEQLRPEPGDEVGAPAQPAPTAGNAPAPAGQGAPRPSTKDDRPAGAPVGPIGWWRRSWPAVAFAASLVFAAVVAFAWSRLADPAPPPPLQPIRALAVLPFESLSPEPDHASLGDGITDELVTQLSRTGTFDVVTRMPPARFTTARPPLRETARASGADAFVQGTVLRQGDRVRASARLVDGRRDVSLWTGSYERGADDLPALVADLSGAIATRAQEVLDAAGGAPRDPVPTEAYDAYLRGRLLWSSHSQVEWRTSIEYLSHAIDRAPRFARAHAALGRAYATGAVYGFVSPRDASSRARAAASEALRLDEHLADAHVALGDVLLFFEWDWTGAEAAYRRALDAEPENESASRSLAWLLTKAGRFGEAVDLWTRLRARDPVSPAFATGLANTYIDARQFDAALDVLTRQEARGILAPASRLRSAFAVAHAGNRQCDHAISESDRAIALLDSGDDEVTLVAAGWVYATCGRQDRARELLRRYEAPDRPVGPDPISLGALHAALGDTAGGLALVERGVNERSPVAVVLDVDLMLDPLRADPAFQRLAARVRGARPEAVRPGSK